MKTLHRADFEVKINIASWDKVTKDDFIEGLCEHFHDVFPNSSIDFDISEFKTKEIKA